MSTNANSWSESLINDWMSTQRQYWDTWTEFARKSAPGGNGDASAGNPFMGNPFSGNPFLNQMPGNPFATNPFAQSPFAGAGNAWQNPFAGSGWQNPFAATAQNNPFEGLMEQWWSAVKPEMQGDLATVAQRFYDMGKNFMSMADGVFGAAGHDQPEAAMQLWMSGMQAMLQQWIDQLQNGLDVATPDLPGVSGTTLSTWAQLADTVSPWLHMSQNWAKDVSEGHLPGGIEMPGVGAAQEQLLRALSMPGLGYTREQQERVQKLARHLLEYHDALRGYKIAFAKTALTSLQAVQKRLQSLNEAGEQIESLRALYDMWIDASEESYAAFAMSDEYQVVYAELVNALMKVRQDLNAQAEHQYELMNIPTRSEIDTMQRRQQELRRENRALRHQVQQLATQVESLMKPGKPPARQTAAAPKQDSLPIDGSDDDLTEIKGIGPRMMEKLYAEGINNFAKLARLNKELAEQLDDTLKTQGRIMRDDWIGQAKKLNRR